jgi:hypothetical protein
MKILMGNNTLELLAGSETWIYTLACAFKKLGHEVTAYSPQLGFIAMQLEKEGIKCVSGFSQKQEAHKFNPVLEEESDEDFDVIICNHYQITHDLHKRFPKVPIIATVHGILHADVSTGQIWPEHPVTEFKVDQYVAVSEEVQGLLKDVYGIESVVIRNFFDLEKFEWSPQTGLGKPNTFLINSNYLALNDPQVQVLKDVVKHYDAQFKAIGANFAGSWDLQEVIKGVDVVIGMGRSVLEGFVMGKIALVQGRWGTGGVLTPETYETIRQTNFSGRNSEGKYATKEEIISMIDGALNLEQFEWQQKIVEKEHSSIEAANSFLDIAERLCRENNRTDKDSK